jgi:Protein of unknown function (DUF3105)
VSKESRRSARLARESRRLGGPAREPGARSDPAGTADGATESTPSRSASRPTSGVGARAGRRDRPRPGPAPSFFERYRTVIVTVAAVAIVAIAVGYVFIGSTAASYTCDTRFNPSPTPPVGPESSTRLGFHQDDMGNTHITSAPVNYTYCPPASGSHFNLAGTLGPIPARLYKPDDKIGPPNWIHNLEHGGMVVLYRNDSAGASAAGQQAFKDYGTGFPASPICQVPAGQLSPVIARFDDMPHPFALLVWDRVMYLDTWDPALATRFYLSESERLDSTGVLVAPPEKQCAGPSAVPAPSVVLQASGAPASDAPSGAPSSAPSGAASASPAPSAAPS